MQKQQFLHMTELHLCFFIVVYSFGDTDVSMYIQSALTVFEQVKKQKKCKRFVFLGQLQTNMTGY